METVLPADDIEICFGAIKEDFLMPSAISNTDDNNNKYGSADIAPQRSESPNAADTTHVVTDLFVISSVMPEDADSAVALEMRTAGDDYVDDGDGECGGGGDGGQAAIGVLNPNIVNNFSVIPSSGVDGIGVESSRVASSTELDNGSEEDDDDDNNNNNKGYLTASNVIVIGNSVEPPEDTNAGTTNLISDFLTLKKTEDPKSSDMGDLMGLGRLDQHEHGVASAPTTTIEKVYFVSTGTLCSQEPSSVVVTVPEMASLVMTATTTTSSTSLSTSTLTPSLLSSSPPPSSSLPLPQQQHQNKRRKHSCSCCSKAFSRSCDLQRHLRIHTGEKPYGCSHCGKTFSQSGSLTAHMRIHTGEKKKLFECRHCHAPFIVHAEMLAHCRSVHQHRNNHTGDANNASIQCTYCRKVFVSQSTLATHLRVHTGEKPFACSMCAKSFAHKSDLTKHIRSHTGEKPFRCNICQKLFSRSTSLTVHMRRHTGEKPFCCIYCAKTFSCSSYLTKHTRTHTGEKPYVCKHCDKSFRVSSHLARHTRGHARLKGFDHKYCKNSNNTTNNNSSYMDAAVTFTTTTTTTPLTTTTTTTTAVSAMTEDSLTTLLPSSVVSFCAIAGEAESETQLVQQVPVASSDLLGSRLSNMSPVSCFPKQQQQQQQREHQTIKLNFEASAPPTAVHLPDTGNLSGVQQQRSAHRVECMSAVPPVQAMKCFAPVTTVHHMRDGQSSQPLYTMHMHDVQCMQSVAAVQDVKSMEVMRAEDVLECVEALPGVQCMQSMAEEHLEDVECIEALPGVRVEDDVQCVESMPSVEVQDVHECVRTLLPPLPPTSRLCVGDEDGGVQQSVSDIRAVQVMAFRYATADDSSSCATTTTTTDLLVGGENVGTFVFENSSQLLQHTTPQHGNQVAAVSYDCAPSLFSIAEAGLCFHSCAECGKIFFNGSVYRVHLRSHATLATLHKHSDERFRYYNCCQRRDLAGSSGLWI